jgi:phosphoenolpyruvate phosphomutase / 2-hydroxyethylphosphonate cytidylyltransferase
METVFVAMSADIFHTGHLNIIKVARELGDVVVGLGTDEVNAQYKQIAFMSYEQRKAILENIKGVTRVIPQPSLDLVPNLRMLKPDYVVHGDDWKTGFLRETRQGVIDVLQEWGGQLIEPPYTSGISSTNLRAALSSAANTPEFRSRQLHRLLRFKPFVRAIEVHNGLTAAVVENAHLPEKRAAEFDVLWLGADSEALSRGICNTELNQLSARLQTVEDILHCTRKPLVVDLGNCSSAKQFAYDISRLERLGIAGVAVSLPANTKQGSEVILQGRGAVVGQYFALIAGIGTLETENQVTELLNLAKTWIQSGADALLLNLASTATQTLSHFLSQYNSLAIRVPILVKPMGYLGNEAELIKSGVQTAVYTNQLLQAAFKAMRQTAVSILQQSQEISPSFTSSLDEIYTLLQ